MPTMRCLSLLPLFTLVGLMACSGAGSPQNGGGGTTATGGTGNPVGGTTSAGGSAITGGASAAGSVSVPGGTPDTGGVTLPGGAIFYDVNSTSGVTTRDYCSGGAACNPGDPNVGYGLVTVFSTETAPVPEPTSFLLLGTGLGAIGLAVLRRKNG